MRSLTLIILFFSVILTSGCLDDGGSSAGIAVDRLEVEPKSIPEGNSFSISLDARNAGLLEGNVDVGNEEGKEVLTNYCPDYFNITSFEAQTNRGSKGNDEYVYTLEQGERMQMQWRLNQEGAEVPTFGYECNLRFEIPFNYSVRGFKQVEILEDREVETNSELTQDSSAGPLEFDIELIGTSASRSNTLLKEDNASIYLTVYNQKEEDEGEYLGLIEMQNIEVETNGALELLDSSCLDKGDVVLSAGEQDIYRCPIDENDEYQSPSSRGEIETRVNYTYVRDIGSRKIEVKPDGR
jgi:hypothetical protein